MAGRHLPTIDQLVTDLREDLDEPLDVSTNFWTDAYLLTRLNRGLRQVWATARETKENWFVRTLRSDDAVLLLYGRAYDPAQLALAPGATEIVLPPDYAEALSFDALGGDDSTGVTVGFEWARIGSETFREGRRVTSDAQAVTYAIDVRWGDGGPRLLLSPVVADDATTVGTTLTYVYGPKEYESGDALENSGWSWVMLDAALAYAALEARRKEGVATNIALAQAAWLEKVSFVTRTSGPRQSQAPEVVEGWMEDSI